MTVDFDSKRGWRAARPLSILVAVLAAGCVGTTEPGSSGGACRDVFVDENIPSDGFYYFNASFKVSSRTPTQIRGILDVQRIEITSWGEKPRIRGQASVVLDVKPSNEAGMLATGSGKIGEFKNVSNRDGSFTDFMWRPPLNTFDVHNVYVQETRITMANIRANFFAADMKPILTLRRKC